MAPSVRAPQQTSAPPRRCITTLAGCALTALVSATLAMAGCGASVQQHQARYQAKLQTIDTNFSDGVRRLLSAVSPTTARAQTAREVGRFELELASVEAHLRSLRAPAAVARDHRHLVRAIDRYALRLRAEVAALRSGNAHALVLSGRRMLTAARALSADVGRTVASIRHNLGATTGAAG